MLMGLFHQHLTGSSYNWRYQKCKKTMMTLTDFLRFLKYAGIKAERKHVGEIDPWLNYKSSWTYSLDGLQPRLGQGRVVGEDVAPLSPGPVPIHLLANLFFPYLSSKSLVSTFKHFKSSDWKWKFWKNLSTCVI